MIFGADLARVAGCLGEHMQEEPNVFHRDSQHADTFFSASLSAYETFR
jgi:hypothetical protein